MSQNLKVTVSVELDGNPVAGFPVTRRISLTETYQFAYEHGDDGDTTTFTTIPDAKVAESQALVLTSDQAVNVRLDGQTDQGILLNTNGLLLIIDADIDAGAGSNVKINNNSGSTANITGVGGGT